MRSSNRLTLLGNISVTRFLEDYWQKKPLLIRQAIPEASDLLGVEDLFRAACDEDVEARLIERQGKDWHVRHGPFPGLSKRRSQHPWTLLVQGLNLILPQADTLLRQFNFLPYARLDDVMASYAVPGGGVGPHFDNYDVFLLQVAGRRRWRIGIQSDLSLVKNAPLKILRRFSPGFEWDLEPGDMLYLPPQWAHDGIALEECITCSIGFRAPPAEEIISAFLGHLQEGLQVHGRYSDPDLKFQRHPASISASLIDQFEGMINHIKWSRKDIEIFAGLYLTEPKAHVYFKPPGRPVSLASFRKATMKRGIRLDPRTLMLYRRRWIFVNGELLAPASPVEAETLRTLADKRELEPPGNPALDEPATLARIYEMYGNGFLHLR